MTALSDKERAYQAEAQLFNRELKKRAVAKARAKEQLAVEKHEEDLRRLAWYHKQRDHQQRPMKPEERKTTRQRLYTVPSKPSKGGVYA